jgi:putative ABC transport system permease protein
LLKVEEGRLMSDDDEKEGWSGVVIGMGSRDQLFPYHAIGEILTMNGSPYTVIGVIGSYGSGPDTFRGVGWQIVSSHSQIMCELTAECE